MKLLLHICCAPCSIMCIETLRGEGIEPVGFWDNPNIHPFTEFRMRRNTLVDYAKEIGLSLVVEGGYGNDVTYEYVSFQKMKPEMMQEAIKNAELTARQFAENSSSELGKITNASQGQFSIDDRDANTPYIKKVRGVITVTY